MLDKIRTALRVKTGAFDDEILTIIEACKLDLASAGVKNIDESNPLIIRAVATYAKANFGFDDSGERYQRSYDTIKRSLALASLTEGDE